MYFEQMDNCCHIWAASADPLFYFLLHRLSGTEISHTAALFTQTHLRKRIASLWIFPWQIFRRTLFYTFLLLYVFETLASMNIVLCQHGGITNIPFVSYLKKKRCTQTGSSGEMLHFRTIVPWTPQSIFFSIQREFLPIVNIFIAIAV